VEDSERDGQTKLVLMHSTWNCASDSIIERNCIHVLFEGQTNHSADWCGEVPAHCSNARCENCEKGFFSKEDFQYSGVTKWAILVEVRRKNTPTNLNHFTMYIYISRSDLLILKCFNLASICFIKMFLNVILLHTAKKNKCN
jgi:hypothetical protein